MCLKWIRGRTFQKEESEQRPEDLNKHGPFIEH